MTRSVKWLTPLATVAVVLLVAWAHAALIGHYPFGGEPRFAWVLVFAASILVASYATGVTEAAIPAGSRLIRSTTAVGAALAIFGVIAIFARQPVLPLFDLAASLVLVVPVMTSLAHVADQSRAELARQERAVAVSALADHDRLRIDVQGHFERPAVMAAIATPKALLPTDDDPSPLSTLVARTHATLLVLDREAQASEEIVAQAAALHRAGLRIRTLSLFYDEWLGKLPISELERIALLFDIHEIHHPRYTRLKRLLDVTLAAAGLVPLVLAVPFVVVANLAGNRGPLFYRQERVGKNGDVFTILKFRSMAPGDVPSDWTAEDDPRLSAVGRVMRKLHIDELPQMWNVLRRDLSIVGPRPEQPHYVERLVEGIPFYDTRHLVRPGLTGWAQVKYDYGASEQDALEKLQYDFYYLRHQSLALDLRIIGRTMRSVVGLRGR